MYEQGSLPYLSDRAPISQSGKQTDIKAGRFLRWLRNRLCCACSHYFDRTLLSTSCILENKLTDPSMMMRPNVSRGGGRFRSTTLVYNKSTTNAMHILQNLHSQNSRPMRSSHQTDKVHPPAPRAAAYTNGACHPAYSEKIRDKHPSPRSGRPFLAATEPLPVAAFFDFPMCGAAAWDAA